MTINVNGTLMDLSTPRVMGILNLTPDSFYDGGRLRSDKDLLTRAEAMLAEGADILDLGGYSTRPSAAEIGEAEELRRVQDSIALLVRQFPGVVISIDTFRAGVARAAVDQGAAMVNDVSGGQLDPMMIPTVGELQVPYVLMHMRGTPKTMQSLTDYEDVTIEVARYFSERLHLAREHRLKDIILDPGFGFAKTLEQNYTLFADLPYLTLLGHPVLVGVSRKSMIYKPLGNTPEEALNGTTVLNMMALEYGARFLRVHDVKEAVQCVALHRTLKTNTKERTP